MENNRKWVLLNSSQIGPMGRGQSGKKKVYEILVAENVITFSWGMAEKVQRQSQRLVCRSHQDAVRAAYEKINAKRDRGYEVAYAV
jgi:predicted DNA-binding WGR domain protein